jgi:hypothetical protein
MPQLQDGSNHVVVGRDALFGSHFEKHGHKRFVNGGLLARFFRFGHTLSPMFL